MSASTNESNEVLAYCGSCKMDLTATIVAKVGSKIAKVLCKTCKKERAYRPAKGVTEPGAAPTATTTTRKRASSSAAEAPKAVAVEVEWQRLLNESSTAKAARVKYSPKAKLSPGEIVEHPTFGDGVVTKVMHPDKAEIIFRTDVKLLIHSRA